jgi:hypothetical protein
MPGNEMEEGRREGEPQSSLVGRWRGIVEEAGKQGVHGQAEGGATEGKRRGGWGGWGGGELVAVKRNL